MDFGKDKEINYKNKEGKIIEKDQFFKDYHVIFKDNTEDWFCEKYLRKIKRS